MRPFIAAILVLTSGCTTEAPWGILGRSGFLCFPDKTCDPGLTCTAGICLGGSDTCTLNTVLEVEAPPQSTIHDTAVIRGRVGGEATEVLVWTGRPVDPPPIAGGGPFCVEVPLEEGEATQIAVVARNDEGCVTSPETFDVTYDRNGTNVVAGLRPRGPWPRVTNLTDGSLATTMQFSFRDERDPPDAEVCDTYTYLWFSFDAPTTLHRMVVHYPEREDFAQYILCWSLLYSTDNNPGLPYPARDDQWSSLGQSAEGRPERLVYDFEPVQAKHIALLVFEDGQRGETESFEIAEVEIYSPPADEPFLGCQ